MYAAEYYEKIYSAVPVLMELGARSDCRSTSTNRSLIRLYRSKARSSSCSEEV